MDQTPKFGRDRVKRRELRGTKGRHRKRSVVERDLTLDLLLKVQSNGKSLKNTIARERGIARRDLVSKHLGGNKKLTCPRNTIGDYGF